MIDLTPLWDALTDPQVLSGVVGVLGTALGVVLANRHTLTVADRERGFRIANQEADTFEGHIASLDSMKATLLGTHRVRRHYARERRQQDWPEGSYFFDNIELERSSMRALRARIAGHPLLDELEALSVEMAGMLEDSGKAHERGIESEADLDSIERRAKAWDERAAELQQKAVQYHESLRRKFLPRSWKDRFRAPRRRRGVP